VTTICILYPDLLGTYGDGGNGLAAVERARRRGLEAELVSVGLGDEVPDASLYLSVGERMDRNASPPTSCEGRRSCRGVRDGANVLAVCAGLQILGMTFCVEGDDEFEGLGLVDVVTLRGERRSVGNSRAASTVSCSSVSRITAGVRHCTASTPLVPSSRDAVMTEHSTAIARRTFGRPTHTGRCSR